MFFIGNGRLASLPKGLAVAAALAALTACSEEKKAEAPEVVRPVKVTEMAGPDNGRMLVYSGSVKARTEMNLGFRVAGKITERSVDIGDVRFGIAVMLEQTLRSIQNPIQIVLAARVGDIFL